MSAKPTDSKICACGCGESFTRAEILKKTNNDKSAFMRRKYKRNRCRLKGQKRTIDRVTTYELRPDQEPRR